MNVRVLSILALIGVKVLFAADASQITTQLVLKQAMQEKTGKKKVFKTIMHAVNRYREIQICASLIRRCGLQHPLNNYSGKKKPRGKKRTKFLSQLPPDQKITFLAPLSDGLLPVMNKIRAAEDKGDKTGLNTALEEALTLLQAHIIKGEFTQDALKGQIETLGGTKINMDNIQFYQADVKTGNGVLHIIRGLATDAPKPATDKVPAVVDTPADVSAKPAEGEKQSVDTAAKTVDSAAPVKAEQSDSAAKEAPAKDAPVKDAPVKDAEAKEAPAKLQEPAAVVPAAPAVTEK